MLNIRLPKNCFSVGLVLDMHGDVHGQPPELPPSFHHDARVILTLHHGSGLC